MFSSRGELQTEGYLSYRRADLATSRPSKDSPSHDTHSLLAHCHALTGLQKRGVQVAPAARATLITLQCAYKTVSQPWGVSHCRADGW